jgi:hypothetical protein
MTRPTRPHITCKDGTSLSIQAGKGYCSTPQNDFGLYTHVEVGCIRRANGKKAKAPKGWHCMTAHDPSLEPIYANVPVKEVLKLDPR